MPTRALPRRTSPRVAASPGCVPLRDAYARAIDRRPRTWGEVERIFLDGMRRFDENVASGTADMGDLQNGKGDFFNDLLALLLENCAGVRLYSRGKVPGLMIPRHNLDVTFPARGPVEFVLEAKAVGTPKHPGSPRAKAFGRPGSADLDKRIKEVGLKSIDLKAEFARIMAAEGHAPQAITGDLTSWLRSVKPRSYLFIAARVVSDNDLAQVIAKAQHAELLCDAVGVYAFRPDERHGGEYTAASVPSTIELSRVLFRACQELTAIKAAHPDAA